MKKTFKYFIMFSVTVMALFINLSSESGGSFTKFVSNTIVVKANNVDVSSLINNIELAEKLNLNQYTISSKNRIEKALAAAKEIEKNIVAYSQSQVDAVSDELFKASKYAVVDEFLKVENLYKEASFLVNESDKYNLSVFTPNTFSELKVQVISTRVFLDSNFNDQEDAKRVYTSLKRAYDGLKCTGVNESKENLKSNLQPLISESLKLDPYDYSKDSYNLMVTALDSANLILNNENSSRHSLDVSKQALEKTLKDLVKLDVNYKSKLSTLISDIENLDKSLYKEGQVDSLISSLSEYQVLFEDSEEEVLAKTFEDAYNKLQGEKDKLVLLEKDLDPNLPKDDSNQRPQTPDKSSDVVETGIEQNQDLMLALFVGAILVVAGLGYYMFKNKKDSKSNK